MKPSISRELHRSRRLRDFSRGARLTIIVSLALLAAVLAAAMDGVPGALADRDLIHKPGGSHGGMLVLQSMNRWAPL